MAAQVISGDRLFASGYIFQGALRDDFAAVGAGRWTYIDNMVGTSDYIFIVLYHYDRIAQACQSLQYAKQSVVVAFVQAYRRLVQHVADSNKATADLRSQADSLRLTAGKCAAGPVQGQISEPDIDHEFQPGLYFF